MIVQRGLLKESSSERVSSLFQPTKNLSFAKHSKVIPAFSKYFVKEGVFPEDFGRKIKDLRKNREIGINDIKLYVEEL